MPREFSDNAATRQGGRGVGRLYMYMYIYIYIYLLYTGGILNDQYSQTRAAKAARVRDGGAKLWFK